jgi:hypothetical protein
MVFRCGKHIRATARKFGNHAASVFCAVCFPLDANEFSRELALPNWPVSLKYKAVTR